MADYYGSFEQQNAEQRAEDAFISATKRAQLFTGVIEREDLQREVRETAKNLLDIQATRLGHKPYQKKEA